MLNKGNNKITELRTINGGNTTFHYYLWNSANDGNVNY